MKLKFLKPIVLWICLIPATLLIFFLSRSSPIEATESNGDESVLIDTRVLNIPHEQSASPDGIWRAVDPLSVQGALDRVIIPDKYRLIAADMTALDNQLAQAPQENSLSAQNTDTILHLPIPDGSFQRFKIEEYSMMEPGLAAQFPEVKTYLGIGLDDPTATIRLDRTPAGFHAIILSSSSTIYIDPYSQSDITTYMSYYKRDYGNFWGKELVEKPPISTANFSGDLGTQNISPANSGQTLRTYRLAVAATVEYTTFHGGQAAAQAAIVTTINRVNAVYEREIAVRLTLVANNTAVVFTTEPDGYTDGNDDQMLVANTLILANVIGTANYDIGHVFGVNGAGIANLAAVCDNAAAPGEGPAKGGGVSQNNPPVGDPFDVDYVAHEMGHQFGADHSYNTTGVGGCTTRNAATAYEPASGVTIMSYVGICGTQDLQSNAIDTFHGISYDQIMAHITNPAGGDSCAQKTATGNAAPVVEAGANFTIPRQTPFELTGTATDANGPLTYSWEEFDAPAAAWTQVNVLPNTDAGGLAVPIFRSYVPVAANNRNFPAMNSILNKSYQNRGESLPNIARTMNFRLTARDNQAGGGGVGFDAMQVTVDANSGPFRVTSPVGTQAWPPASQQTITWNVASTTNAPVSCNNVNILMSTDGGQTFPLTMLANTPNDGSQQVTLPGNASANAVIKVQCTNNIFFDAASVAVCTPLLLDTHEDGFADWTASIDNNLNSNPWQGQTNGGFSGNNYWRAPDFFGAADSYLDSQTVNATADNPFLRFQHSYNFDAGNNQFLDGGRVEISINGGAFNDIGQANFTQNGYNVTLNDGGNGNPLNGQQAFGGNSNGYIASVAQLNTVTAGQNFAIRFRNATSNNSFGTFTGWSVDDVLICNAISTPTVNLALTKIASTNVITSGGGNLTYTLVAQNNGTLTANNIVITDTVPALTTLNAGSLSGDAATTGTAPGSLITWTTGANLATGQSLTRTFIVVVSNAITTGNQIVNTAFLSAANAPAAVNASATTNFAANAPGSGIYLPIVIKN